MPKCIVTGEDAEMHHVLSRGSRPDLINEEWNQIPLSRKIHTQWHTQGTKRMAIKYPQIRAWLILNEWYFAEELGKYWHDKAMRGY